MKLYVGVKKMVSNDETSNAKMQYGFTVYSDEGEILHSSVATDDLSVNKFENSLKAIAWAVRKFKTLVQNKNLPSNEKSYMVISSKTIYGWFEKEVAPEPYTVLLGDIYLEFSFLIDDFEILLAQNAEKRVLYKNSNEDKGTRATDLFK